MRALDQGESFVVTRNGVPGGDLTPVRSRQFVRADVALQAFAGAPALDPARYRTDLDAAIDQDAAPRV